MDEELKAVLNEIVVIERELSTEENLIQGIEGSKSSVIEIERHRDTVKGYADRAAKCRLTINHYLSNGGGSDWQDASTGLMELEGRIYADISYLDDKIDFYKRSYKIPD